MKNKWKFTFVIVLLIWGKVVAQEPAVISKNTSISKAKAQSKQAVSAKERQFFKWFFENEISKNKTNDTIFYLDKIASESPFEKEGFDRDTLVDMNNGLLSSAATDSLILTKAEKEKIFREFDIMPEKKWGYKLYPKAISLKSEDLTKFFITYRWKIGFYTFSKPLFLRNNTLCIMYSSYVCGDLCGSGGFTIYAKQNGKWKRWLNINRWIS